jgi:hypothetical protein
VTLTFPARASAALLPLVLLLLVGLAGTPPAGVDPPPRCVANATHGCAAADAPWPANRTFAANDTAAPPGRGWPRPAAPAAGPSVQTASVPISPCATDGGAAMTHPGARYMHAVPGPHLAARLTTGFTAALVRSPLGAPPGVCPPRGILNWRRALRSDLFAYMGKLSSLTTGLPMYSKRLLSKARRQFRMNHPVAHLLVHAFVQTTVLPKLNLKGPTAVATVY